MLPHSFDANTFERMMDFLTESNRIEGIEKVNYKTQPEFRRQDCGHFGALILSQRAAENHAPLKIRDIRQWQELITREQITLGEHIEEHEIGHIRSPSLPKNVKIGRHIPPHFENVPTLLDHLIEKINESLKDQDKLKSDAEYCKFLGATFLEFEQIHPFADGNGRTGRLLANYIATYCNRPIILFNSEIKERNSYIKAHEDPNAMISFMAKKVQEVIFGLTGKLLLKLEQPGDDLTCQYHENSVSSQSSTALSESYEWHDLAKFLRPPHSRVEETD